MDMPICLALCYILRNRIVFYSTGMNHYEINNNHDTIHAEVDSIMNLPINRKKKKNKNKYDGFKNKS